MAAKDTVFLDQLAAALIGELPERELQDRAMNELEALSDALHSDQSFRDTLLNPALSVTERKKMLRQSLDGRIQPQTLNALLMLLREHRLDDVPLFIDRLRSARLHIADIRDVLVVSAVPLNETERNRLKEVLARKWQTPVYLRERVEPAVIAGLSVTADDWHFDATIKGRMKRLTQKLLNA